MTRQLRAYLEIDYLTSEISPKTKTPVIAQVSYRISQVAAQAYVAAADAAARAATSVGALITATDNLSLGVFDSARVRYGEIEDTAVAPAADSGVYRFDKFAFKYDANTKNYQVSIPCRDMTAVELESDGVSFDITASAASAWVTAFEAIGLGDNGYAPNVRNGFVLK